MDLSIIIPAFNRVGLLKYTLESVRRAIKDLEVEVIIVDDGSEVPLAGQLNDFSNLPMRFIRQENAGSIAAVSNGFRAARGEYVLLLDSDDLAHEDKLTAQVAALNASGADICYTDMAVTELSGAYDELVIRSERVLPLVRDVVELCFTVQPLLHNPIYRRSYLRASMAEVVVPADRQYDWVGDVWLLLNLSIHPAMIVKVDGPLTIYSAHDKGRNSDHWETRGVVAFLSLLEAFLRNCPRTESTLRARTRAGERAFNWWRALPRRFAAVDEERIIEVWRSSPKGSIQSLGERRFQILSHLIGVENAARMLRHVYRLRRRPARG